MLLCSGLLRRIRELDARDEGESKKGRKVVLVRTVKPRASSCPGLIFPRSSSNWDLTNKPKHSAQKSNNF